MHGEHGLARIRDRNSNSQLVMGFSDVLVFDFTENFENVKGDFSNENDFL